MKPRRPLKPMNELQKLGSRPFNVVTNPSVQNSTTAFVGHVLPVYRHNNAYPGYFVFSLLMNCACVWEATIVYHAKRDKRKEQKERERKENRLHSTTTRVRFKVAGP